MAGQAELKILISIVDQTKQALTNIQNDLKTVTASFAGLSKADMTGVTNQVSQLNESTRKSGESAKESALGIENLAGKMDKLGEAAKFAAGGFLALEGIKFVKDLADTAGRVQVLGTVLATVGFTAGYSRAEMDKADKSIQKLGITATASRQSLSQFVQSGLKLEGAEKLARVAQDTAVISGKNSSQEFSELITAIQEVSVERLRYRQIIVNQKEAEERYVEAQNKVPGAVRKSADALSGLEKQQALLNEVIRTSTRTAGVYEAALGDVSKQISSLARYQEQLKVSVGNALLPSYLAIVEVFTQLLKELNLVANGMNEQADTAKKMGEIVREVATNVKDFIVFLVKNKDALEALGLAFAAVKIGAFVTSLGPLLIGFTRILSLAPLVATGMLSIGTALRVLVGAIGGPITLLVGLYFALKELADYSPRFRAALALGVGAIVLSLQAGLVTLQTVAIATIGTMKALGQALVGNFSGAEATLAKTKGQIKELNDNLKESRELVKMAAKDVVNGDPTDSNSKTTQGKNFGNGVQEIATNLSIQKTKVEDLKKAYDDLASSNDENAKAKARLDIEDAQRTQAAVQAALEAEAKKRGLSREAVGRLEEESLAQQQALNSERKKLEELREAETQLFANKFVFSDQLVLGADFAKKLGEVKLLFKDLFTDVTLKGDQAAIAVNKLKEAIRLLASNAKTKDDLKELAGLLKQVQANSSVPDSEKKDAAESVQIANKSVNDAERNRTAGLRADAKANQKALDDIKVESAKNQQELNKIKNDELESEDKGSYDRGLLSLDDYYANRLARAQDQAKLELASSVAREALLRNAAKFADTPASKQDAQNQIQQELDKRLQDAKKEALEETKLQQEQAKIRKDLLKQVETLQTQTAKGADPLDLSTKIQEINDKYDHQLDKLKGIEGAEKAVAEARAQEINSASIENQNAVLQRQIDLSTSLLQLDQSKVTSAKNSGQITDAQRIQAENTLLERRIDLVNQQIAQRQKTLQGPATDLEKNTATKELADLQSNLVSLGGQFQSYGKTLSNDFAGNLGSALDQIVTRSKTAREALRGLALNTLNDIGKIASTNLAEGITKQIGGLGGGGGIFGQIGGLLGDGTKPGSSVANPLYTLEVGPNGVVKDAAGSLGGLPGAVSGADTFTGQIQEAGKTLFDTIGSGFSTFLNFITTGFESLIGLLTASAATSGAGEAVGSGLGGILGAGAAAVAAATGGLISGPGSGTSDSIPAMLSDGEFVVKADSAKKYGPLLHALNDDKVQGVAAHFGTRPVPKFAGGGQVGGGAPMAATVPMQASTRIINSVDPELSKDYMESPGGEQIIINHIRRNANQVKQLIR